MEKRKPWQLTVILLAITLTIYNILPTIFYYSKPLNSHITESSAKKIAQSISSRVNDLEKESIDWVYSFCDLLQITPKSVKIEKNSPQKISIEFSSSKDANVFSKYLPRAGSMISFVPAQLKLAAQKIESPKTVTIHRELAIRMPEDNSLFKFAQKFDENKSPSNFYRKLVFDQVTELGLTIAGTSENAKLLSIAKFNNDPAMQMEIASQLAQNINSVEEIFGKESSITKRYFSSFTQALDSDKSKAIASLTQSFQSARDALKLQKLKVEESTCLSPLEQEKEKAVFDRKEALFTKAERLLKEQKSSFLSGQTAWTTQSIQNLLNQTYDGQFQKLEVGKNNPFISKILIDWEKEKVFFTLHTDLLAFEKSLKDKSREKNQLQQLIINEIARISRITGEKILPKGDQYSINLSSITDSQSFLSIDLGKVANLEKKQIISDIAENFVPEHTDLLAKNFPLFDYTNFKELPLSKRSVGLVAYAPSEYETETPDGIRSNSVYVIAKGLNRIVQKYQKDPSSQEAKGFFEDFYQLRNLLQESGYNAYPGSILPESSGFSNDFIFEKPNFYQNLIKATREDFKVRGTKRFATLELSTHEQRMLTLNKIEDQMHEELIRSRDEYNTAQVSLDPYKKFDAAKPSKSIFLNNLVLSMKKYFRGDERKILHWGLDLSGGKAVQIELRDQDGRVVTNEHELKEGINELYNRVNKMGVSEVSIRQEGSTIALDFPGSQAISAEELIKSSSMFFHIVNEKFSTNNPSLSESVNRFLQEVWNEALVTNRTDPDSINTIAFKHIYGDSLDQNRVEPRSEAAQVLYENGLRLSLPSESRKSGSLDSDLSMIAVLRNDEINRKSHAHPLFIVFKNYALEGSSLQNVRTHYDPSKGNFLSFDVKGSYTDKEGHAISPRDSLYSWTSLYAKDKISGTTNSNFSRGKGWRMAVVLNDTVISAPELSSALRDSASITGSFSQREASKLSADLKAGSLTYTPKILSEKNISPELGTKEKAQGIAATLIALLLVVAAMTTYYRFAGVVASVAVIFNLLILWGALQNIEATLSLAGIAGVILTVGMAVDANVLVFERIREEFEKSNRLASAIKIGYQKAFSAIFDSNITTLMSGVILLSFDSGPIKGFALTLIIGIVSSMFTALFMTRYFFSYWIENTQATSLKMMNVIKGANFNFLKTSKYVIITSLVLIVVGNLVLLQQRKSIFGMEFTGGYALNLQLDSSENEIREKALEALTTSGATAQDIQVRQLDMPNHLKIFIGSTLEQEGKAFYNMPLSTSKKEISYVYENNPRISWVVSSLEKAGLTISEKSKQELSSNWAAVSGQMSDTMKYNAIWGLTLALLAILVYITIRYEFKFAFSAMICLIHDVLISLGIIAMLHYLQVPVQIDLNTIAALMLIVGYSLNDTIVIFDRIREDLKTKKKLSLAQLINDALNTTLSRTVITSLTTFLVLLALIVFGGSSIFGFSLVMALGVVFGTLSSIFIASPIMLYFHKKEEREITLLSATE